MELVVLLNDTTETEVIFQSHLVNTSPYRMRYGFYIRIEKYCDILGINFD